MFNNIIPSTSPREKLLIILASLALLLYIFGAYITVPTLGVLAEKRRLYSELTKKKAALSVYDNTVYDLAKPISIVKSKNQIMSNLIADTEHNLHSIGHEKDLMPLLSEISSETGIFLTALKSSDFVVVKKMKKGSPLEYRQREITVKLVGGYYPIGRLLERLSSPPLRLERINITFTEEAGILAGELTLIIFSL